MISEVPRVFAYDRDPKDEPYINLAIAAGANYIVSWDNDILDLAESSNLDGEVNGFGSMLLSWDSTQWHFLRRFAAGFPDGRPPFRRSLHRLQPNLHGPGL